MPLLRFLQQSMTLRIIEKPRAARVSKNDVESLRWVRELLCLMVMLRRYTLLTDSSLLTVALLRLHPLFPRWMQTKRDPFVKDAAISPFVPKSGQEGQEKGGNRPSGLLCVLRGWQALSRSLPVTSHVTAPRQMWH